MDKIYSRRRLKLPNMSNYSSNSSGKQRKILNIIIIILIAIFTAYGIIKSVKPIYNGLAIQKARAIATEIMNKKTSEVLEKYDYKELVWIMQDSEENNKILRTDVVKINQIASEIAIEVEKNLQELQEDKIYITLGSITGNEYLVGVGPKFPIKVIPSGNITTELNTEFKSKGINQTIYRIYLELDCEMKILTGYSNISDNIENQILLVETVIVGDVPESYYNIEGLSNEESMELISN